MKFKIILINLLIINTLHAQELLITSDNPAITDIKCDHRSVKKMVAIEVSTSGSRAKCEARGGKYEYVYKNGITTFAAIDDHDYCSAVCKDGAHDIKLAIPGIASADTIAIKVCRQRKLGSGNFVSIDDLGQPIWVPDVHRAGGLDAFATRNRFVFRASTDYPVCKGPVEHVTSMANGTTRIFHIMDIGTPYMSYVDSQL